MNKFKPIPAIDIINGKCVRLKQGKFEKQTTYSQSPLEIAKMFDSHKIKRVHIIDLDGAKTKSKVNFKVIEQICQNTNLNIDLGGGIRTEEDIKKYLGIGVKFITITSLAIQSPQYFLKMVDKFSPEKFILSADVLNNRVKYLGWSKNSKYKILDFIDFFINQGILNFMCTDIQRDGMLKGPSITLYKTILKKFPQIKLIASGGVHNFDDILSLSKLNLDGVIFGKAFYEGNIKILDISQFLKKEEK